MKKEVMIIGYGVVAKEFVKLILETTMRIKKQYNIDLLLTSVIGSKGMIYQKNGINIDELLKYGVGSKALYQYAKHENITMTEPKLSGDVLIDCTPTNIENGEPGLSYTKAAMKKGMDVVFVSKGPLVHSFSDIINEAKNNEVTIKYSGATAAALPTLDIGEYSLAGCQINRIEGILNGTTNFILTKMVKENRTYEEALKLAQDQGIAESDPYLDVSGLDSAFKILLLTNSLLGSNYTIKDMEVIGIDHITKENIKKLKSQRQTLKLLARMYRHNGKVTLDVRPCELNDDHPLLRVDGTNKGILFETEEMGEICVTGGASHPKGAAMAALKDLINIY